MAIALSPISLAALTSCRGVNSPSEAWVWLCRSAKIWCVMVAFSSLYLGDPFVESNAFYFFKGLQQSIFFKNFQDIV
jgi:hypothetical protein